MLANIHSFGTFEDYSTLFHIDLEQQNLVYLEKHNSRLAYVLSPQSGTRAKRKFYFKTFVRQKQRLGNIVWFRLRVNGGALMASFAWRGLGKPQTKIYKISFLFYFLC